MTRSNPDRSLRERGTGIPEALDDHDEAFPSGAEKPSCPDAAVCRACLCAGEDDTCLPLEREREEVLRWFVLAMQEELAANAGKGDRPGWLSMSPREVLAEVQHHYVKLHAAVVEFDRWENCQEPRPLPWVGAVTADLLIAAIREYAADVANMAMMAADRCGALGGSHAE